MADILPRDEMWWSAVREAGASVAALHDFSILETPVVESAGLLEAGFGTSGRGDQPFYEVRGRRERLALRTETAIGTMRSFLEHHLGYAASPLKVWLMGPVFCLLPPHPDTRRLTHELAFHVVGDSDPVYDMEAILASLEVLRELKFKDLKLGLNTMGCRVCRPHYRDKLRSYYQGKRQKICRRCVGLLEKQPLRLLSCEVEAWRELRADAPIILDYSCQNCNNHFKTVLELIEDNGIVYEPNPYLLGSADYFSRTVFEASVSSFALPLVCDEISKIFAVSV
ncbi:MAG: ATP phosphoribosyltransferase regulatory subunit, partial [Patescibacteria group bacterium]